jgi:hypothetical protein
MGFFDFLKPKKKAKQEEINVNAFLLTHLKTQLEALGHSVAFSSKYAALEVNDEIEIATAPMPGDYHPMMLPMMVITIHPTHFPDGIVTYLTGLGDSVETKVAMLTEEYIHDFFETLTKTLTTDVVPNYSFHAKAEDWEVYTSKSVCQGEWIEAPKEDTLFDLLKEGLKSAPLSQEMNSLKIYVSKQNSAQLAIECTLNNEQWDDGMEFLKNYAGTWEREVEFKALKQFMIIKRKDINQ